MASTNRIPQVRRELELLSRQRVIVGVPLGDKFLQMVASVNETGKVITAKKSWLTIPTRAAKGRKPREIVGLFKPKGKNVLAIKSADGIEVMFVLKKQVVIPPRPFITQTYMHNIDDYRLMMRNGAREIIQGKQAAHGVQNKIGRRVSNDIKMALLRFSNPANAPLTVANKGSNNPLMDTGTLIGSITWVIV